MSRTKALYFYWHLFISAAVVTSISLICQHFWFPAPFLLLDGTWFAILTLASVDIILGPFITLILINATKSKRERYIDMFLILIIQCSALIYGLNKIYNERPFAIIYVNSLFHQIPTKNIKEIKNLTKLSLPKYNTVYYGMVNEAKNDLSITKAPALYSTLKYKVLSPKILEDENFEYDSLPATLQEKYSKKFYFKVLAGKNRISIVVLNEKLEIVDISIIDDKNQYAKM